VVFRPFLNLMCKISLIIPSNHRHDRLVELLDIVAKKSTLPSEIIIIDSSCDSGKCPQFLKTLCGDAGINLVYVAKDKIFPGAARNCGLDLATGDWIAFLDVRTHPQGDWLGLQLRFVSTNRLSGSWGMTQFEANSDFTSLVRDGIYGKFPIRHLPGSLLHRDLIRRVGHFIPTIRAGEDGDWISRVTLLGESITAPPFLTTRYFGLFGMGLKDFIFKWLSYYGSTRSMPFHLPHKFFLALISYLLLTAVAFNWNNLLADWNVNSPYYISNVTKISIAAPIVAYFLYRGIFLPLRRGVGIWQLFPLRFLQIGVICLVLDIVKSLSLIAPSFLFKRRNR